MFFLHQEFAIILYLCLDLRGYFCLLLFCICVLMFVGEGSLVPAYMRLLILALSAQRSSLLNIIIAIITFEYHHRHHHFWTSSSPSSLLDIIMIAKTLIMSKSMAKDQIMRKDDLSRNWGGFFYIFIWFIFYEVYLWNGSGFFYIFIWFISFMTFFMKLKLIYLYFHMIYFSKEVYVWNWRRFFYILKWFIASCRCVCIDTEGIFILRRYLREISPLKRTI